MSEHIPVMANEVTSLLGERIASIEADSAKIPLHLDGTFGRGGHARLLLQKFSQLNVVACDQDQAAEQYAREHFAQEITDGRLVFKRCKFSQMVTQNQSSFDTILLDLGVSSPQLDEGERGFSFMHDGPLDMRMDQSQELTADEIVNTWSENELIRVFQELGEVRSPFRVVRAIVHDRKTTKFSSTAQLASMIARVAGWRQKGFHPSTQYFMALRLEVNSELDEVQNGIHSLMERLNPGGRMAVITFHSLEDRIVKTLFKSSLLGRPMFKKVIVPTDEEIRANSRSRSAKLRVFERN